MKLGNILRLSILILSFFVFTATTEFNDFASSEIHTMKDRVSTTIEPGH